MYWTILINCNARDSFDFNALDTRWGDEAKFRQVIYGGFPYLIKITVYNVVPDCYKTIDPNTGYYDSNRCSYDVLREIQDHLYYCGHDVISCQRQEGTP